MGVSPSNTFKSLQSAVCGQGGPDKKGNKIDYIRNDHGAERQFEYFLLDKANSVTQAGLAWINQLRLSCIRSRSPGQRVQHYFGEWQQGKRSTKRVSCSLEGAIRQPDLAKNVGRYQLAVDEAKVCLDLAIAPGAWLVPSRMVINTDSTVNYNNKLKQATPWMRLCINNDGNIDTNKVGIQCMVGGPPKTNKPPVQSLESQGKW